MGSHTVRRLVAVSGALAGAIFLVRVVTDPTGAMPLFDLAAYRTAGQRVLDGLSLYDTPLVGATRGVFEFVYPPFAALVFVPLAGLHGPAFVATAVVLGVGLLAVLVRLTQVRGGAASAWTTFALTGLLLWSRPVYETVTYGQVNLLVAVLVLADLSRGETARGRGVLLGVAAGLKLTPLFFVPYLLVTRRFSDAARAAGAFGATVALGVAVAPADSRTFWSGAFADPARIGAPGHPGNESLRGFVATHWGDGGWQRALWLVVAAGVAGFGLWVARGLSAQGREPAALVLCGLVSTAVSPYSWVHHWVWLAPLLVLLLDRATRRETVPGWLTVAVVAAISAYGFSAACDRLVPELRGLYGHAYVWLTVALLAAASAGRRRWRSRRAEVFAASAARSP